MKQYKTTIYSLPVINVTGNGLIEIVDPDNEDNVLVVMDVEEADIFGDELDERIDMARENRREFIQERRDTSGWR